MLQKDIEKDIAFLLASPPSACSLFAAEGRRYLAVIEAVVVVVVFVPFVHATEAIQTIESERTAVGVLEKNLATKSLKVGCLNGKCA